MKAKEIMQLAEIHGKFKFGTFTLQDVAELTDIVWNKGYSAEAKKILLEIPLKTLEIVELKMSDGVFAHNNGSYFAGNSEAMPEWKDFFLKCDFKLDDVHKQLREVIENHCNNPFLPRNAEVTIRDDVKVKECYSLKEFGPTFAYLMERAFEV